MSVIPNNVDWSATAAWIALAISIVGTIASPLITSLLNNRHQMKLYKLQSEEKRLDALNDNRMNVLQSFLANTGKYVSTEHPVNEADFGSTYFAVYQYVPEKLWNSLDTLYEQIVNDRWAEAHTTFLDINREIASLLKAPLR